MTESIRKVKGLPVFDATKSRWIHVTKRDLENGYTMLPNYCVVAHALGRQENGKREAIAQPSVVLIKDRNHWERYMTSSRLRIEIIIHDRGGEFMEGEYKLLAPIKSRMLESVRNSNKKSPTGKKREHHFLKGVRERLVYKEED